MKRISIFLLFLFVIIQIYSGSEKLVLAISSLSDGFNDYAIKYCKDYLKEDGANIPYGKMVLGLAYYRKKEYKSAIMNFKDILFDYNNFPKIKNVKLYLALSYLDNKEEQKGLKELLELKKTKLDDRAFFYEGLYYMNKKNYDFAIKDFSYIVENNLDSILWDKANLELSILYNTQKRYDLLEKTVLSYLERSPKGKYANRLRFMLALNYYYIGTYDKAIKNFNVLIDNVYKIGDSYFYLADSYYYEGEFNKAIINYKKAIDFKTQFLTRTNENIILSYINLEKYENALQTIKKLVQDNVKIDPLKIKYYYLKIYYAMKKYDTAKLYLEPLLKSIKSGPMLVEISLMKGNILYNEGNYSSAVNFLKKENAKLNNNELNELLGDIYSEKDLNNSLLYYNKIINSTDNIELKDRIYLKIAKVDLKYSKYEDAVNTLKNISIKSQNDEYNNILGRVLYNLKKYDEANVAFLKVENNSDFYIESAHYMAWILEKTGYINDAIAKLGHILDMLPKNGQKYNEIKFDIGKIYYHMKNYSAALPIFIELKGKNVKQPLHDDIDFLLAKTFYKLENYNSAKKTFEDIVESKKYGNEARFYHAWCNLNNGDNPEAIKEFQSIYNDTNSPFKYDAELKVGDIYFNEKKYDQAVATFEAIINSPNVSDYYKGLAAFNREWTYFKMGKYQHSIDVSENFLKKFPNSPIAPQIQLNLGKFYFSKGDYENSANEFEKLLVKFPSSKEIYESKYYIGLSMLKSKNPDKAYLYFKDLQGDAVPSQWKYKAMFKMASILFMETKYKDAMLLYKKLANTDISQSLYENTLYNMAIIDKKLRNYQEARSSMEKLVNVTTDPQLKNDGRIFLGELYELMGYIEKAEKEYSSVIIEGNDSQQVESEFWLAKLYQNKGDYDKAIDEFMKIIYLYKKFPMWVGSARFELVDTYLKKGDDKNAKKMLGLIIEKSSRKDEIIKAQKMLKNIK